MAATDTAATYRTRHEQALRGSHAADPRAVRLALTEQGRETTRKAIVVVQGLLRQLLTPLGGPDSPHTQEFTRNLTALLDAPLDPFGTPGPGTEPP